MDMATNINTNTTTGSNISINNNGDPIAFIDIVTKNSARSNINIMVGIDISISSNNMWSQLSTNTYFTNSIKINTNCNTHTITNT